MDAFLQSLLLFAMASVAGGACYKHKECQTCIGEVFDGGSCLWYQNVERSHPTWSCIAGMVEDKQPKDPAGVLLGSAHWSAMTPQGRRNFSALHVDTESQGSCYDSPCTYKGACDLGFYAVENRPCYDSAATQEWRFLRCCREQRLTDGYLRGFEERDGIVRGTLRYVACCFPCSPGRIRVGCDAFLGGTCELCPQDTYNPTGEFGSTCQPCQPCPAGFERKNCGPSTEGRCEPCANNYYKTLGLEGDHSDMCQPCDTNRCNGKLYGCFGPSAGYCRRCPTGEFFSGICRQCNRLPCDITLRAVGCGGNHDRTCVACRHGQIELEKTLGRCRSCSPCDENKPQVVSGAFTFSGPSMRVGCGAWAEGDCVRFAVALDGVAAGSRTPPLCNAGSSELGLYCPGIAFRIQWAVESALHSYFGMGKSNCSHAAGACIAGLWRASLHQRSFSNPEGLQIASLGYFDVEEPTSLYSDGSYLKTAILDPLPVDLLGGAGYFIRLAFEDVGDSCCYGAQSSPMYADTEDFQVVDVAAALFAELQYVDAELVSEDASSKYQAVEDRLRNVCADGVESAVGGASAEFARHAACEKLKALRLGLNIGDWGLTPLVLPPLGATDMATATAAAKPVKEAREALKEWHALTIGIPATWAEWKALLGGSSRRLSVQTIQSDLMTLGQGIAAAANSTRRVWQAQITDGIQQLEQAVKDLQDLDAVFADAVATVGFSAIRMAQGTSDFLWDLYRQGYPNGNTYDQALDAIGCLAVMLLGTWRGDWTHELTWFFTAQVGEVSDVTFQTFRQDEFGGVQASGDVPLNQSRSRVWVPFLEVSTAWLDRMAVDINIGFNSREAAKEMKNIIGCIQTVTEQIFEPLSRIGASLLKGALPSIVDCGVRGVYLQNFALGAADVFTGMNEVVKRGLGPLAHQPWNADNVERQHLLRVSQELVGVFRRRATLFRRIFLQMLDIRDMLPQTLKLQDVVWHASTAMAQLPSMNNGAAASGPTSLQAEWRWYDSCSKLLHAMDVGKVSAACLCRRNLGRLQRLALWIRDAASYGINEDMTWRRPWPLNGSSADLNMAEWSAMVEIATSLGISQYRAIKTGFLRIEATAITQPLLFAGLTAVNQYVVTHSALPLSESWQSYSRELAKLTKDTKIRVLEFVEADGYVRARVQRSVEYPAGWVSAWKIDKSDPSIMQENGRTLLNLQDLSGHLTMHREVYAYLIGPAWGPNSDNPTPKPTLDPQGISVPYVELELQHLAGDIENMVHSSVPMFTRHERRKCAALGLDMIAPASAALEPFQGLWMLSLRDGATGERLEITESTYLRLLIKIDAPRTSQGPWNFLPGGKQYLYQRPSGEDCDGLLMLNGSSEPAEPSNPSNPSMSTRTTTGAQPTTEPVVNNMQSTTNTTIVPAGSFLASQNEDESDNTPIIVLIVILSLVVCICCLTCIYLRHWHRCRNCLQRSLRKRTSDDDVAAFDSPSPKGNDQLRHRGLSPKMDSEAQDLRRMHGDVLRGLGQAQESLNKTMAQPNLLPPDDSEPESEEDEDTGSESTNRRKSFEANHDTPRNSESESSHSSDEDSSQAESSRTKEGNPPNSGSRGREGGLLPLQTQQRGVALAESHGEAHFGSSPMLPPLPRAAQDTEGALDVASSSCSGDSRRRLLGAEAHLRDAAEPPLFDQPPLFDHRGVSQDEFASTNAELQFRKDEVMH